MTSFRHMQQTAERLVTRLVEYSGLCRHLVENIVLYAKCLTKSQTSDAIEELVFTAQMATHFQVTNKTIIHLMFFASKKGTRLTNPNTISLEEFCRCICMFLSPKDELRIEFVFNVYDQDQDGILSYADIYTMVKPNLILADTLDDVDAEDGIKDIVELVFKMVDFDSNRHVDFQEFVKFVKADILNIDLLGPCMPTPRQYEDFLAKLENRTHIQVKATFLDERQRCLNEVEMPKVLGHYPILLDLP